MPVSPVQLPPLADEPSGKSAAPSTRLAALAGVAANLTVVAGHASTNVGELLSLQAGTVMALDTALNAPFDIILGDQIVARGELVAVGDRFGVRITDVAPHDFPR